MRESIEVGYQTFVSDGGEEFGAVRQVAPQGRPELVIYVENAGDFVVPLAAVEAVHSQKVILNCRKLDRRLREAIGPRARCRGPRRLGDPGSETGIRPVLGEDAPVLGQYGRDGGCAKKSSKAQISRVFTTILSLGQKRPCRGR